MTTREIIASGQACLGIELGSTRIKAVLIGPDHAPIASGDHSWENQYENGIWTYSLEAVWTGMRDAYANLAADVEKKYQVTLTKVAAIGISAMMHGYLPFDKDGRQLAAFRTWRNTITAQAAAELTELFQVNIPQRWSIAHLYQAMLNGEAHVKDIAFLTTLEGYVHWQLTGEKVLGVGEVSGMFPVDSTTINYNETMIAKFDTLTAAYPWKLRDILPRCLAAGEKAGYLTEVGAKLLDPSGNLQPGIPFCPPEGDAGTGMVATNSVAVRTGNVSAGTSIFAMVVLERMLSQVYEEIDMVTTPSGKPVAMVHCNNCTNEINAWAQVFKGLLESLGQKADMGEIFTAMFSSALDGEADAGKVMLYNYLSGEVITGLNEGRPLLVRPADARLTFPNFMRAQLYSALATLKIGMEILEKENAKPERLFGHGGFYKTPVAGQRITAAALDAAVSVMETAGEGGPWGMAILAAYMVRSAEGETLEDYLEKRVFAGSQCTTEYPQTEDQEGFAAFMTRYKAGLAVERAAVEHLQ